MAAAKEKPKGKGGKEDLRALVEKNAEEAAGLADRAGGPRLARLLGRASVDLKKRIGQAEGLGGAGEGSFTAEQARVTRKQLGLVARSLGVGLRDQVLENAQDATELGVEQTVAYMQAAEARFSGIGQPLPLRPVEMLDAISMGAQASQLRRLVSEGGGRGAGILDRYGMAVVGSFEETLQAGLLAKTPWADVRDQITDDSAFLQGKPQFWAERIVRTESMGAYARGTQAATEEAAEEIDDLVRILSSIFDDRTGWDSYLVHGQIRRVTEPFATPYGPMMTPPDRPNDRGIIVTHRVAWAIPEYLKPRPVADAQAAWIRQGRKGGMPPRPEPMTTVPLESFGKGGGAKAPEKPQEKPQE